MISVIFPHHSSPEQDKLLALKLQMLKENTQCEYEVLYLVNNGRRDLVYSAWDFLMRNAKYPLILWDNSDIVYAKNWDVNVLKHKDDADWIGLELVECGQIGVADSNICKDFGITADTFRRDEFEQWAKDFSRDRPSMRPGFCWYSPSVWKKSFYIDMGGFNLNYTFPHPIDSLFREEAKRRGKHFIVANSVAYHFQRAGENLGEKPERI